MLEKILKKLGYIKKDSFLTIYQTMNDNGEWVNIDGVDGVKHYRVITIAKNGSPSIKDTKHVKV